MLELKHFLLFMIATQPLVQSVSVVNKVNNTDQQLTNSFSLLCYDTLIGSSL